MSPGTFMSFSTFHLAEKTRQACLWEMGSFTCCGDLANRKRRKGKKATMIKAEANETEAKTKSTKAQGNKEVVLCENDQDWQTLSQTNQKREKTQFITIRDGKGGMIADATEIPRMARA